MKNLFGVLLAVCLISISVHAIADSCLPGGAHFYHQGLIDSFQFDYPSCTEIEGDVIIGSNGSDIVNLSGLHNITSIGGNLTIVTNDYLHSLSGLEELKEIGGDLYIIDNDALYNLYDLEELAHIGGDFKIINDSALTSIGGSYNSLITIDGDILISGNPVLVNISGLQNINASLLNDLSIYHNISLSDCAIESMCNYLSTPTGAVNIYQNAAGCNNPPEIADACGIMLPCLPFGNFYFFTQNQIDNFHLDYPDCNLSGGNLNIIGDSSITNLTGLQGITAIGGNLVIYDNMVMENLHGLDSLHYIEGTMHLGKYVSEEYGIPTEHGNPSLNSLGGLDGLISIGGTMSISFNDTIENLLGLSHLLVTGGLEINGNHSLYELTGLSVLEQVSGSVNISKNEALTNLNGLETLAVIGGHLGVSHNNSLSSLDGLDGLDSIGSGIELYDNPRLTSLTGLSSLKHIGDPGSIHIYYNDSLTTLSGLDNIEANSISHLALYNNPLLSSCSVQSICDFLSNPNGIIRIFGNDTGCNNAPDIAQICGNPFSCLPYGDYYLLEQAEIDSFRVNYADCSELTGQVLISGENITRLDGLSAIHSITGDLYIYDNDSLVDLYGLDSLTILTGDFYINQNDALEDLKGLASLATIEGALYIGYNNGGNKGLKSLNGLNNLENVRSLSIGYNDSLLTLEGIENIDEDYNWFVYLEHNHSLAYCEVESICNMLAGDGNVYVEDNAPRCNSEDDILVACGLGFDANEISARQLSIYPNPASTTINIEIQEPSSQFPISIFNLSGQVLISSHITDAQTLINISTLPPGVYFARVTTERTVMVGKFVKQ